METKNEDLESAVDQQNGNGDPEHDKLSDESADRKWNGAAGFFAFIIIGALILIPFQIVRAVILFDNVDLWDKTKFGAFMGVVGGAVAWATRRMGYWD